MLPRNSTSVRHNHSTYSTVRATSKHMRTARGLGDTLLKLQTFISDKAMQPRYRVLVKLSFGYHAIVWLVRNLFRKQVTLISQPQ